MRLLGKDSRQNLHYNKTLILQGSLSSIDEIPTHPLPLFHY
jgi:hypothetical protein